MLYGTFQLRSFIDHCSVSVNLLLAAAGTEAEVNGVAEVTKQLEKQVIEDKEKEDGEEGDCLTQDDGSFSVCKSSHVNITVGSQV